MCERFFCQVVEKPQEILCVFPRILKPHGGKRSAQTAQKEMEESLKTKSPLSPIDSGRTKGPWFHLNLPRFRVHSDPVTGIPGGAFPLRSVRKCLHAVSHRDLHHPSPLLDQNRATFLSSMPLYAAYFIIFFDFCQVAWHFLTETPKKVQHTPKKTANGGTFEV